MGDEVEQTSMKTLQLTVKALLLANGAAQDGFAMKFDLFDLMDAGLYSLVVTSNPEDESFTAHLRPINAAPNPLPGDQDHD